MIALRIDRDTYNALRCGDVLEVTRLYLDTTAAGEPTYHVRLEPAVTEPPDPIEAQKQAASLHAFGVGLLGALDDARDRALSLTDGLGEIARGERGPDDDA